MSDTLQTLPPPPPPGLNYTEAIRPSLNFILILTPLGATLVPLIFTLLYFSTPQTRRHPVFILNILACCCGICEAAICAALQTKQILYPLEPLHSFTDSSGKLPNVLLAAQSTWPRNPYIMAEWTLQMTDNLLSLNALESLLAHIRSLFLIALGNFVFPIIMNIASIVLIATDPSFINGAYIFLSNNYVTILGVVFATIWTRKYNWNRGGSSSGTSKGFDPTLFSTICFVPATSTTHHTNDGATYISRDDSEQTQTVETGVEMASNSDMESRSLSLAAGPADLEKQMNRDAGYILKTSVFSSRTSAIWKAIDKTIIPALAKHELEKEAMARVKEKEALEMQKLKELTSLKEQDFQALF
ncbi:hypothetical protein K435DRAFT_800927 [Dendrothele bispora CBS 962.96]|uniref:Uncharacterized protein n=1 Tax=Dendrothele bispora (strain CBS 962.96) TaxID=1314807 RepID=A0A4S8LQZ2_DENBC|nr:hypothetical protein K435DRAFT_800927 [Dendrothele bispora CBS 962.96]